MPSALLSFGEHRADEAATNVDVPLNHGDQSSMADRVTSQAKARSPVFLSV